MVIAYIRQEGVSPFSVDVLVFKRGGGLSPSSFEQRAVPLLYPIRCCRVSQQHRKTHR